MKKFWMSKTFWLNVIAIIVEIFKLNPVGPETSVALLGAANIALRFFTSKPIK